DHLDGWQGERRPVLAGVLVLLQRSEVLREQALEHPLDVTVPALALLASRCPNCVGIEYPKPLDDVAGLRSVDLADEFDVRLLAVRGALAVVRQRVDAEADRFAGPILGAPGAEQRQEARFVILGHPCEFRRLARSGTLG